MLLLEQLKAYKSQLTTHLQVFFYTFHELQYGAGATGYGFSFSPGAHRNSSGEINMAMTDIDI
jgi:hypothetical protein